MTLNIARGNSSSNDSTYRYKMPSLIIKTNRSETIVENITVVCKSLHTKPEYVVKFFATELGTRGEINLKTAVLKGLFNQEQLTKKLQQFIERYILCIKCSLPETCLEKRGQSVYQDCSACGFRRKMVKDKTVQIMLATLKEQRENLIVPVENIANDDDIVWFTDTSPEAVARRKKEEFS